MTTPSISAEIRSALLEQLTERLRSQGLPHPDAAAVALAARGDAGTDLDEFCAARSILPDLWRLAEAGRLDLGTVHRLLGC